MHAISRRLHNFSTGWITIIALVIFVVFMATVLPRQAEASADNTGSDQSPDTSFFYTTDDLYNMAEAYGENGRQAYIRARFTFDLIFPLVYTAFLVTTISWCFQQVLPQDSLWRLTNLVPIFGMILDYLENSAAALVMARFPVKTPGIASLTPIFTILKWIFVYGSFIILLGGISWVIWKWASSSKRQPS